MKKLICMVLAMSLILTFSGCNGKQAEFEPVEGYKEASEIIYNIEFGVNPEEYGKTPSHKALASASGESYYDDLEWNRLNDGFVEGHTRYMYYDYTSREGSDYVYSSDSTKADFMHDKLISLSFDAEAIGENDSAEKQQKKHVAAFMAIAEEMGFVRQDDIPAYRWAFTLKDGYRFGDGVDFYGLNIPFYDIAAGLKWEANEVMTQEEVDCMESEECVVRAENDIIYYLSPDGTKALAICPQDARSERRSIYFYGDSIWIERSDGVVFDPDKHDYNDFNGGLKPETIYAPVVIAYYDIQAVRDNLDTIPSWVPNDPIIVELLRDFDEMGEDAFFGKNKEVLGL